MAIARSSTANFERHPEERSDPLHRRALALSHLFAASRLATVRREYRAHWVIFVARSRSTPGRGFPRSRGTPRLH